MFKDAILKSTSYHYGFQQNPNAHLSETPAPRVNAQGFCLIEPLGILSGGQRSKIFHQGSICTWHLQPPFNLALKVSFSIYRQQPPNSLFEQPVWFCNHSIRESLTTNLTGKLPFYCFYPYMPTWMELFLAQSLMNIWLWSHFTVFVEEAFISETTCVLCCQHLVLVQLGRENRLSSVRENE